MMRLVRIATASLLLTALPAMVRAECGWVLWSIKNDDQHHKDSWDIGAAFETLKACQEETLSLARDLARLGVPEGRKAVARGGVVIVADSGGKAEEKTEFWCYPGGTDPRPRYKE